MTCLRQTIDRTTSSQIKTKLNNFHIWVTLLFIHLHVFSIGISTFFSMKGHAKKREREIIEFQAWKAIMFRSIAFLFESFNNNYKKSQCHCEKIKNRSINSLTLLFNHEPHNIYEISVIYQKLLGAAWLNILQILQLSFDKFPRPEMLESNCSEICFDPLMTRNRECNYFSGSGRI